MAVPLQLFFLSSYTIPFHPIEPGIVIADVTQRISQRLKRLFLPLCAPPGLGAFALPPEITLEITSHLDNSSTTSLALTCQTLYHICFPGDLLLYMVEKEELLLLLEKDVADLYFCHQCVKLHRWHRRWSKFIPPWYDEILPCKRSLENHLLRAGSYHISYYHARLVMNRHFYGFGHGPPPKALNERTRSYRRFDRIRISNSLHARIVDDQLLLLSVRSMSHAQGDSAFLRRHIDSWGSSVCAHLNLAKGYADNLPIQLPELFKDESTLSLFRPCDQTFGSCTFCLTDYSIDISWHGKRKGFVVKLSIYCQLGDCRSPLDWNWHTMSTRQIKQEPRTVHSLEYKPGFVRNRWNKADGITSKTPSTWIDISGARRLCVSLMGESQAKLHLICFKSIVWSHGQPIHDYTHCFPGSDIR